MLLYIYSPADCATSPIISLARSRGSEAALAMERLDTMISESLRSRTIGHSAAAWLGWRAEGRRAPLPAAAAEYLAGMDLSAPLETADPADPHTVLRFAFGVAGIRLNMLDKYASERWPTCRPHLPIRHPGAVNTIIGRRFIETLQRL
jgi:hypothetical protein